MIEINNLTVQFGGVRPIDGLSVQLDAPVVGLIGPNGAGKTTLLNVLSGFVTPLEGQVIVAGKDLTSVASHQRPNYGLRRTFQTDQIADDLTLWQNVEAIADHAQFDNNQAAHDAVAKTIEYVGLSHRIHRLGGALSTGERHLAEIAKALIGSPCLVMLDEPGAGMSESESKHLEGIIRGIPEFCQAQVFLIDHDVALIDACCEQTMVLDFGRLLAKGPTAKVLNDAEVRKAYLGEFDEWKESA